MPEPSAAITVLLADSDYVSRTGLASLLAQDPRCAVAGEARRDVVTVARRWRPGRIVLDPLHDNRIDLALVSARAAAVPESRLAIYTAVAGPDTIAKATLAGVD